MKTACISAFAIAMAGVVAQAAVYDFNGYSNGTVETVASTDFTANGTTPSKYTVVASGGLSNSKAVDLVFTGGEPDATVLNSTSVDLGGGKVSVGAYFKKKVSNTSEGSLLQLGLHGLSTGTFTGANSFTTVRISPIPLSTSFKFQTQERAGSGSQVTTDVGATFSLVNDNWYYFQVDITKGATNTFLVDASLANSDSSGVIGSVVASFTGVSRSVFSDLYNDTTVFGGFRGYDSRGLGLVDNFSVVVPEPALAGLLGLSGLFLRRARR